MKEVIPVKYAALRESVFRFYRGTAHLFYEDLAKEKPLSPGPKTWICGDLHLENYGTYKGDNRLVYFDINDFDECVLAPVSLEVLRMITSICVACKELQIDAKQAEALTNGFLTKYFKTVLAGKPHSFQRETAHGVVQDLIQAVGKRKDKELLEKRTEYHKGVIQLSIIKGKTSSTPAQTESIIEEAFVSWNESKKHGYKMVDMANRIMGTGSLGLERYILLCVDAETDKPVLLDLKEAAESCVLKYFDFKQPHWENDAHRVKKIQSLLQDTPPALLDYFTTAKKSYVIKELQPSQDKLDLSVVSRKTHKFEGIIDAMADITASAHLRAAGRFTAETGDDLIEYVSKLKQKEMLDYALTYSRTVESDFKEYVASSAQSVLHE